MRLLLQPEIELWAFPGLGYYCAHLGWRFPCLNDFARSNHRFTLLKQGVSSMQIEASHTFHTLYLAVYRAHKEAPDIFTDHECNRIMTAIMAAKQFSWRVIGITEAALKRFSEFDFRYKSKMGLTRAHLKPRIATVRSLLAPAEPLGESDFLNEWLQNDKTVLCAQGENTTFLPTYIEFENANGELFSCHGKLAGWRHGQRERDFLRALFERRQPNQVISEPQSVFNGGAA